MKYIYAYLFVFMVKSTFSCLYAQESLVKSGNKKYDQYAFIDAIKVYEQLVKKGYKSEDMFKKLGNANYFNSNFKKSSDWYSELYTMNNDMETEYFYRYVQSLKSTGQTVKSKELLEKFSKKNPDDLRAKLFEKDKNYVDKINANIGRYEIKNAIFNSKYSDYGSSLCHNKLYFASARDTGVFSRHINKWTGEPFTNLYCVDLDSINHALSKSVRIQKLNKKINSKFHESSPVFTKDGKTVYFTRNNYLKGKRGKDKNDITLLKIYRANLDKDKWTHVVELPFNSDNYSASHPALSPDEGTLYFASDMPGTLGQSDIFKVEIKSDGSYGEVLNLGSVINSEGRESFPYVTDEKEIYFASDGHPGLGGLDIFVGEIDSFGSVKNVQNIGADINSGSDEFAYVIDTKTRQGFFSSNKSGGLGSDDIYTFTEKKKNSCVQELEVTLFDSQTQQVMQGVEVNLYDENFNLKNKSFTDSTGKCIFKLYCDTNYVIRASKENYEPNEKIISIINHINKKEISILLTSSLCKVAIGDDLGKCFDIKMIYFELDKFDISRQASLDLEKILVVLKDHPTMKLDIRSYADSRSGFQYNMVLSEKRTRSTINWLVQNGIQASRLSGKGYGESKLVNICNDGVGCSENEHQENRRSEFIISAL